MSKRIYVQKIKANNNHIEKKSVEDTDIEYIIVKDKFLTNKFGYRVHEVVKSLI
jgi:hypothetical protein